MGTIAIDATSSTAYRWNALYGTPSIFAGYKYYIHIDITSDWRWINDPNPNPPPPYKPSCYCGLGGGLDLSEGPWVGWRAAQVIWSLDDGVTWSATGGQSDHHWNTSFIAQTGTNTGGDGVWVQITDSQWDDNGGTGTITIDTMPICWQLYARRKNGMTVEQHGPSRHPAKLYVPRDTDPESSILIEDGEVIPRSRYELLPGD